ncbi:hypothetical protein RRG08_060036 [Elysia crispata]|uniref:Uncharacterized protein n=1 Tax=Elysia crispata TaxID=231223 RepID=A0AAE0YEG6_9GAST|nr:hypothetical protein RRG08_060036 [Elysia crispata]
MLSSLADKVLFCFLKYKSNPRDEVIEELGDPYRLKKPLRQVWNLAGQLSGQRWETNRSKERMGYAKQMFIQATELPKTYSRRSKPSETGIQLTGQTSAELVKLSTLLSTNLAMAPYNDATLGRLLPSL